MQPHFQSLSGWPQDLGAYQETCSGSHLRPSRTSFTNKPRKHSKKGVPRNEVSTERARQLEKNRVAANKCRMKRKKEHHQIQNTLDFEFGKHQKLKSEVDVLREQIWNLKNEAFIHSQCGDGQFNHQLQHMTHNALHDPREYSQYSSPTFSISSQSSVTAEETTTDNSMALQNDDVCFDTFLNLPI